MSDGVRAPNFVHVTRVVLERVRKKIPKTHSKIAKARGDVVYTDIETVPTKDFYGNTYVVHFTDSYSRFSKCYPMKSKTEIVAKLELFIDDCCKPAGVIIKCIKADDENVYVRKGSSFRQFCIKHKIELIKSGPYCKWQNGVAERVIRTMMEKAFTLMAQTGLEAKYWAFCISHVYMVNNCLPHSTLSDETPYWRWYERDPDLRSLHIFGCDVRVNTPPKLRKKYLTPPAEMGVYIGFEYDSASHIVYFPSAGTGSYRTCGDGQCVFFEVLDDTNYLKKYTDKA